MNQNIPVRRLWHRSIEEDRSTDTRFEISCSMVEIYNEVVHDLLSMDVKRQVELQKTATGFDIPTITTVGTRARPDTRPMFICTLPVVELLMSDADVRLQ